MARIAEIPNCPLCHSTDTTAYEPTYDPDTVLMVVTVCFKCFCCEHEWEGVYGLVPMINGKLEKEES